MKHFRLRAVLRKLPWIMALCISGCQTAQQQPSTADKAAAESASRADEAQRIAEASLGRQSEILAQGDLALNGREQILVVNRISGRISGRTYGSMSGSAAEKQQGTNSSPIPILRAAVLEKSDGKWSQILLCDEHLKNQNGYLGGLPTARVEGWQLEFVKDARQGLEMNFTPADKLGMQNTSAEQRPEEKPLTFIVRWNKNTKRYQSFDKSHERYLSEVPSLEAPESILK